MVIAWSRQVTRSHPTCANAARTASGAGTRSLPSNFQTRRRTPEVMSNIPSDISQQATA
jgi:hypothetical protein